MISKQLKSLVSRKLKKVSNMSRMDVHRELKKCRKLMNQDWKQVMDTHVKNLLNKYSKGDINKEFKRMQVSVSWKSDMVPYYDALKKKAKAKIIAVKKKATPLKKKAKAVKKKIKSIIKKKKVKNKSVKKKKAKKSVKKKTKKTARRKKR